MLYEITFKIVNKSGTFVNNKRHYQNEIKY